MHKRLKGVPNLPFPPIVAGLYGLVAGFLVYSTPQWLFEYAVDMSGIAQFVPAATPPLGENARLMAAVGSVFAVALLLLPLLMMGQAMVRKSRRKKAPPPTRARGIVIADSIQDDYPSVAVAPLPQADMTGARAPIFADHELGAPLMSDEALAAGEELVLEEPLDAAPLLAEPGMATSSADLLPQPAFVPEARSDLPLDSLFEEAPAPAPFEALAQELAPQPAVPDRTEVVLARLSDSRLPDPVPSADMPVSQFQISVPVAFEPEIEPIGAAVSEPMRVDFGIAHLSEEAQRLEQEAVQIPSPVEEKSYPREWDNLLSQNGINFEMDEPLSDAADPFERAQPAPVAAAPAVDLGFGADPLRVKLFPDEESAFEDAPLAQPMALEVQSEPMRAAQPVPPPAADDHSVGGLMARLNFAMGARSRPPVDEIPPMKVGFGSIGRQPA